MNFKKIINQNFSVYVSIVSLSIIYLWIGIFKFTEAEANAIVSIVKGSPFMSWMYSFLSIQEVSNVIGIIEILIAIVLLTGIFNKRAALIGSSLSLVTMLVTISFLFTTPGVWQQIERVWITDFFILKDIWGLAISTQILFWSLSSLQESKHLSN